MNDRNYMNQNCSEVMLTQAAKMVMKKNIDFNYGKAIKDNQVDLTPAFIYSKSEKMMWYSGNSKANFEKDMLTLDESKVYFLRTGRNNGAGHWQNLYYDKQKNGWVVFSSKNNNYQLTEGTELTTDGLRILSLYASWGPGNGEYAFFLIEASSQNIISAANYLYDFRMSGDDTAMENICAEKKDFYDQIQCTNSTPSQFFDRGASLPARETTKLIPKENRDSCCIPVCVIL